MHTTGKLPKASMSTLIKRLFLFPQRQMAPFTTHHNISASLYIPCTSQTIFIIALHLLDDKEIKLSSF